jgi:hypothetical protein
LHSVNPSLHATHQAAQLPDRYKKQLSSDTVVLKYGCTVARNSKQATQFYLNIVDNKKILEDPSDFLGENNKFQQINTNIYFAFPQ